MKTNVTLFPSANVLDIRVVGCSQKCITTIVFKTVTHTCSLLNSLKHVLGWDQEVQQASQGVSLIATVDDLEELADNSWGSCLKGRIQNRQQVLDGPLQRIKVLKREKEKEYYSMSYWFIIDYHQIPSVGDI